MTQCVKFVLVVSLLTGGVVCAGCLEVRSAWGQALEVDMLTICHGGQDTAVPETEEDTHGAFTGGGPDGTEPGSYTFDMMKLIVTLPDPACASLEEPVSLEVTGHATLVKQTDEGEHEELGQTYTGSFDDLLPYILVKATAPSEHAKDIEIKAMFGSCEDTVKATAVSIAWIDDEPDYARYATEYEEGEYKDNGDSDNFFLRHLVRPHKDDGTPDYSYTGTPDYQDIDLWYRIMPEDLRELDKVVKHVQISIYREDTSEIVNTIEVDQEDSLEKLDGKQVYHVVWNGTKIRNPATGEFTVAGFYRVELEVQLDGMPDPLTTSIEDGDESLPGWQCPQDGLAIHDLAFKHRPDVWVGSREKVIPNGPVYPFSSSRKPDSPGLIENYRLGKKEGQWFWSNVVPAWGTPQDTDNYYAIWLEDGVDETEVTAAGFPRSPYPVPDSEYPVLEASAERDPKEHYLDIQDPHFKVTDENLAILGREKIRQKVVEALEKLKDRIFTDENLFLRRIHDEMEGTEVYPSEKELILEGTSGGYLYRDCRNAWPYLLHRGIPYDGSEKTHPNYVFLHYWMYATTSHAPYNKGIGGFFKIMNNTYNHEGEWEMVQLALRLRNPEFPRKKSEWLLPYAATASQHFYGQTLAWRLDVDEYERLNLPKEQMLTDKDIEKLTRQQRYVFTIENGKRIKIYIAENAHATYFRDGVIDVDVINQIPGIQVQYNPEAPKCYDQISEARPIERYDLLALDDFEGKGIYDWQGFWGMDTRLGPYVRGPKSSATEVVMFKLTDSSLQELQKLGVHIRRNLVKDLIDKEFIGEKAFLYALGEKIEHKRTFIYRRKILECAEKRGQPIKKVEDPVSFHESCRKVINENGEKDPETELYE